MPLRPLEKQFELKKVEEIRKLAEEFHQLRERMKGESAGYMISGIHRCLETGILLGALSISLSLLDMFVHDMVILYEKEKDRDGNHSKDALPPLKTGHPRLPFEEEIAGFMENRWIDPQDGRTLLKMYRKIGIPLHHVLSRRIGPFSKMMIMGEDRLLDRFLTRSFGDIHHIEEMIEDNATECMKVIVSFLRKYHIQEPVMSLQESGNLHDDLRELDS
ncbi:MAG: hypothetical protein GXP58_01365 [Deltaproteobacteria bacterium]|nr:hypothetical protein [Deltaproteobacteria bacterium]